MSTVTLTMNPAIDKSAEVDRVVPERKLRCRRPNFEPGGGGINVARVLQRLGAKVLALYPAGGPPAQLLESLLEKEHLARRAISIQGWTRENLAVYESSTEQQFRFGMPGPRLEAAEWRRCLDEFRDLDPVPDFLVASGSLPPGVPVDFYARMARLSVEKRMRLIVDTSGEALQLAVAEGLFLIKPNLRELREIAGEDLEDEARQEELVRSLVAEKKCRYVVLSLGAAGVLAAGPEDFERLRAPTVKIQSKVGAGDSTVAGIIFGLSRGRAFLDAVRYGMAAGAAAVMSPGSQLCRPEDVAELYRNMTGHSLEK